MARGSTGVPHIGCDNRLAKVWDHPRFENNADFCDILVSREDDSVGFKLTFDETFDPQLTDVSSSLFASRSNNITQPVS